MDSRDAGDHSRRRMRIAEIYASIQGETQYAGLPCTLVRSTGCDLRCHYCDSTHAFHGGRDMTVAEIVAEVRRLAVPLVLLTGGEPLLQPDAGELCERLLAEGFRVMLETSGAHLLGPIPPAVIRVVDVKTPGSGESDRMRWETLAGLRPVDAIKFVVCDEADYRWAADQIRQRQLAGRAELLLSPMNPAVDPRDLVAWILRDQLPVRVNLQLHKLIWGKDAQGV